MSSPSPLATPLAWNLVSSAYSEEVVPMLEAYSADALRLAAVPSAARVVDVACGPGTLAMLAARQGHPVDAIDFSPEMIARLEARRRSLGLHGITAQIGDGQALPLPDGTYAAGFSMFGLMFFPDRARGFAELRRVLAPGARAVVSSWAADEDHPVYAAVFGAIGEALGRLFPDRPRSGAPQMALGTEDQCREEMSACFRDVVAHRIVHTQRYASAEEMWASMARTMAPLAVMRKNLGDDQWAVVADAGRAGAVAYFADRPVEVAMPAWLTVGVAR